MKKKRLVSVLINCYNGEKYLRDAIDSVFAQTYSNWEIIFWDNASTDDTGRIATSYDSRLKYFRAEINTPLGPARNIAFRRAEGDYIAFLDSDDIYLPHTLQKQIELMESGNYGFVYGGAIIIDEKGLEIKRGRPRYNSGYIFDKLLKRYDVSMASAMVRRSVIEGENLGFDEAFGFCPDYNMFMKIAAKYDIGVLRDYIVKYRRTSGSLSRRTLHLVSKEVGQTLDELQMLYPDAVSRYPGAMKMARSKLSFYDAVNQINMGNYSAARSELRPVIGNQWEYLAIYLALLLPIPKSWLLRHLNR